MIKATACAGAFLRVGAHATSTGPFPHSFVLHLRWSEVEARDACLKRLQFDVVVKTFCDWMNAFFVPTPAPSLTAFNNFNALNWQN